MEIFPIQDTPALLINFEDERILVVADLHLGLSAELANKGIEIPSQIPDVQERLSEIISDEKIDRLFFLGDLKHNVPVTSWEEWEKIPDFLANLSKKAKIEIIPGNHDGDIEGLIPRDVILHESKGTTIAKGKIGLIHGHAWPDPELLETEKLIMGHNHPTIEFKDKLGVRAKEPAWIKGSMKPENLPKQLKKKIKEKTPEIIILPAFSKLVGGGAINKEMPEKLLGPFFKADVIELEEAEVHLLDGTFLGKIRDLKN